MAPAARWIAVTVLAVFLVCLQIIGVGAAPLPGVNMVTDGSFENSKSVEEFARSNNKGPIMLRLKNRDISWDVFSLVDSGRGGTKCLQVGAPAVDGSSQVYTLILTFPVMPGRAYRYSVWRKMEEGRPDPSFYAVLNFPVQLLKEQPELPRKIGAPVHARYPLEEDAGGWERLENTCYPIPDDVSGAEISIYLGNWRGADARIWYDDLTVYDAFFFQAKQNEASGLEKQVRGVLEEASGKGIAGDRINNLRSCLAEYEKLLPQIAAAADPAGISTPALRAFNEQAEKLKEALNETKLYLLTY